MFTIRQSTIPPTEPPTDYVVSAAVYIILGLVLAIIAAWITHVVVSIKTSAWFLLLFGILAPPVGVIHGFGVWFGVF